MGTSSARPSNLERFYRASRAADDDLRTTAASLISAYNTFEGACQWGVLDASSLVNGLDPQFLGFNEQDARWVQTIAEDFRRAGGDGDISTLPDAAIAASLRRAGLGDVRGSVTFDDPVAYGFPPTSGYADDPVNTATGNFVELETDLAFGGLLTALRFDRTYNSRSDRSGPFGPGWSSWASARLRARPDGAEYEGPDGQRALFPKLGSGYGRVVGINALVAPREEGGLALSWFGGRRWEFDAAGLPVRIDNGPGTEVRLRHDGARLVELIHRGGRSVALEWHDERVAAAACSDGRGVDYRYDADGRLVAADRDGAARRYELDADGRILSVTDADGVAEVVNVFDDEGRVVEQLSPFGRRSRYTYLPGRVTVTDDDEDGPANVYVHDGAGRVLAIVDGDDRQTSFQYDQWGNAVLVEQRGGGATIQEFDDRARVVRRVMPTGAELTYDYDDVDRLVSVTASNGATTVLRYPGDERSPSEVVDPEGAVSRMTVEGGLLREAVDADGVALRFEYDDAGDLVATIDADGNVARLERDAAGRVVAAVTPLGRRTTWAYDDRGRPVERHDPGGGVWRYEHTPAGRLRSVTSPTGARREHRYGDHGAPSETVDALGHVSAQQHDVFGNVSAIVAPDGATWQYGYDALMRLTTIADPTGETWRREHDADGNLVASIDPLGGRCSATIDAAGRVTALSDGATSSTFDFDELGRAVAQRRPDGTAARCEYDLCGRRIAIHDPTGGTTHIDYTPAGKALREISPSGRIDAVEYDRCGRVAARIDGAGRRTEFRYDADRALVARVEPNGDVSTYEYDDAGRLVASSVPGRGVTRYEYDLAGRTTAVSDRDAGRRRFAYDAAGRLVTATDANGGVTRYAYDERGRVVEIVDPLGATTTRAYDAAGRVISETDPLGRTATLAYDRAGRIVERDDGSGRVVRWTHDASGRVSSYGPPGEQPIAIRRDALGRMIAIDEPGTALNELRWDEAGRLVERRRGDAAMRWRYTPDGDRGALGYPDGSETMYSYDAAGLLVGQAHPATGTIAFERDASGRLVAAEGGAMRASWRYERGDLTEYRFEAGGSLRSAQLARDGIGRVVEAIVDGAPQRFAYDDAGALLRADTPHGTYAFAYDANGRLAGESSPAGSSEYDYDSAGQLVARRRGDEATSFAYDGAGRRVAEHGPDVSRGWRRDELGRLEHVESSSLSGGVHATAIAVDALGELADVGGTAVMWDSANALAPLAWLGERAVVGHGTPWALAGDGAATWLAPDWQGTIGDAPRDPWGAALDAGAGDGPGLGYRGELEFGGESWLRNRVYEPATRAFVLPDPAAPVPGIPSAANPYHYAADNPIGLSDPLGLHPVSDAQLQDYRDRMDRNIWERGADFVSDNWEYIAAGAMVVGGIAIMATGVGGPIGAAMIGGALLSAGGSTGMQMYANGEVNWKQVAGAAMVGAAAGGLGAGAGLYVSGASRIASAAPWVRGMAVGATEGVVGGSANRGLNGDNPFDPRAMGVDLLTGGAAGGVGGSLASRSHLPAPTDATVVPPTSVRFSQNSVNGVDSIADSMRANGWVGDPIDVVRMPDGGLTTVDNTRVLAAHNAGIDVHANVHPHDAPLPAEHVPRFTTPRGGEPSTWGDAVTNRIGAQNSGYRNTYPSGSPVTGWAGN